MDEKKKVVYKAGYNKKIKDLKIAEIKIICASNSYSCVGCQLRNYDYTHQEEHQCIEELIDDLIISELQNFKINDYFFDEELEKEVFIPLRFR